MSSNTSLYRHRYFYICIYFRFHIGASWKNILSTDRAAILAIGVQLGIQEGDFEAWYKVDQKLFENLGGDSLLEKHGGWMWRLLSTVFPEHKWVASKFGRVPHGFWASLDHQQTYLDNLGDHLGVKEGELDGWYSITSTDFIQSGAGGLLKLYGDSLPKLLAAVYPNHQWDSAKFTVRSRNYWTSLENQRKFMDDLAQKLGIRQLDGWYKVTMAELLPHGAVTILNLYGRSLSKLLSKVYPNHPWDLSKFASKPSNYWASMENQKRFMDDLGTKIGISSEKDFARWYEQSSRIVADNGGSGLSVLYKNSLRKILTSVYPYYNWELWRFPRGRGKVLASEAALDQLFDHLEKALDIRQPEDWYRVTTEQLASVKAPAFYKSKQGGLAELLSKRYPNVKWDADAFFGRGYRKATQSWLVDRIIGLLPSETVLVDYAHPDLKPAATDSKSSQLDVFVPELRLAFEYQGVQHYQQLPVYGNLTTRVSRDEGKAAQCSALGITLIAVPFWWDKNRPSLLAAILAVRPDLFTTKLAHFLEEARSGSSASVMQ